MLATNKPSGVKLGALYVGDKASKKSTLALKPATIRMSKTGVSVALQKYLKSSQKFFFKRTY